MQRLVTSLLCVGILSFGIAFGAQKRVKPKTPPTFEETVKKLQSAWGEQRFSACVAETQELTLIVLLARRTAILAALPAAPPNFTIEDDKSIEDLRKNPLASAMMGAVGNVITREYKQSGGPRLKVTVTADSPIASIFGMWATNPAMLEEGAELIEYGVHKAVLKPTRGGKGRNLLVMLDGKHSCEVETGLTEDELFAFMDQKAVDALAAALAR